MGHQAENLTNGAPFPDGLLVVPAKNDDVRNFSEGMAVVSVDWINGYIVNPLKK